MGSWYKKGVGLLLLSAMFAYGEPNELNKLFHHRISSEDSLSKAFDIELGSVVFYFSKKPIVNKVPTVGGGMNNQLVFFFPEVRFSEDAQKMVALFNEFKHHLYTVKLEEVEAPSTGIRFSIAFDPKKVTFKYESFESIGQQKGLIFRLYDKQLLDRIDKRDKVLLRVADARIIPGIIIDCGHGGADSGTVGCFGVKEKDITLQVGLKVAALLREKKFNVFLTRNKDATVSLDTRTYLANACRHAGAFISIHANASPKKGASGIETFCLNKKLFKRCSVDINNRSYDSIVRKINNQRLHREHLLAQSIHRSTLSSAKKRYGGIVDRSIKHAVSQVLVGTRMPAALIEIGFLSNEREANLMRRKEYQQLLARGIANGIIYYMRVFVLPEANLV